MRPRARMVSPSITVISLGLIASVLDAVLADGAPVTIFGNVGGTPLTIFGSGGVGCAKGPKPRSAASQPTTIAKRPATIASASVEGVRMTRSVARSLHGRLVNVGVPSPAGGNFERPWSYRPGHRAVLFLGNECLADKLALAQPTALSPFQRGGTLVQVPSQGE